MDSESSNISAEELRKLGYRDLDAEALQRNHRLETCRRLVVKFVRELRLNRKFDRLDLVSILSVQVGILIRNHSKEPALRQNILEQVGRVITQTAMYDLPKNRGDDA